MPPGVENLVCTLTVQRRPPKNWPPIGVCLLLAALILLAYWPVFHCEFINYDDQEYVTANSVVAQGLSWQGVAWAFTSGHSANWHPLTWLSHMLDVQLFGMHPAGHHLTNLLLHIANAMLLFLLLRGTTGALWRSALVAALFAVHPLHVESVAWVAERKDVLSTFFGLLSLWAYARYAAESKALIPGFRLTGGPSTPPASRITHHASRIYFLSLLLFALSLMSKSMLVTLPFLLLLLDYWPLGRWQPGPGAARRARRLLLEKAPFLLFSILASVATMFVQQAAMSYYRQLPWSLRIANAAVSYVRYLGNTLWPRGLAVFYPHPSHWPAWMVVGSVLLLTIVSALVLWGARQRPYLPVGWFWFLGLLVPVLGLVQVGVQAMADRYTYLPLVGLFIILAWAGAEGLHAIRLSLRPSLAATLMLVGLCAALTRYQLRFWLNTETIFTHATSVTQHNWLAHYNLALLALRRYQDSQRGPLEKQVLMPESTRRNPGQSGPAPSDYLAAIIYHCQATLDSKPRFPDPHVTLAKALTEQGRLEEARSHLEVAIRLDPKSAEARQNLGEILHRRGRVAEAITQYEAALKLRPDWEQVLNNVAWLRATDPSPDVRNGVEAVSFAQRACALSNHTNLWFLHTLAAAYAENGNFAQAVATADQARQLAAASGRTELVNLAETRLEAYKASQPLRMP